MSCSFSGSLPYFSTLFNFCSVFSSGMVYKYDDDGLLLLNSNFLITLNGLDGCSLTASLFSFGLLTKRHGVPLQQLSICLTDLLAEEYSKSLNDLKKIMICLFWDKKVG